jgi:hypothetical protein
MSFDFSELKKADYNHQSPDSDANQVEHQVDEGEKTDGRGPLDKKPEIMPSNAGTDAGLEPAAVEESSSPIGDVHATPDRSDEEKPKMENDVDEKTPGIDWKKSEGGSMYGMVGENRYRLAKSGNGYTVYHNGNRICDMQKSEDAMAKAEEHFARRAVVENAFYKSASLNKVYLSPSVGRTKPKAAAAPIVGKPAQTGVSAPVAKVATPMDNTSPGKDVAKKAEPSPLDGVKPNAPAVKDGKNVSINKSGSIPMSPQANASASQSAVASAPNTGAAAGAAKMPSIPNHAAPKMPTMKADTELGGVHFKGGKTAGVVGTPRLPGQKPPAEVTGVPNKTGTESGRVGMTNTKGPMAGKRDGGGGVVLNGKDSGRAGMPNTLGKGIDPLAGNKQLNGAVTHSGIVGEPVRPGGAIDKTLGGQKFSGTGNSQSNVGNKATPKVASPYGTPQEQTFQNQGGGKQMPNAPSTGLPASASIGKSGSPWSKEEAREKKDAFKPNPVVKAGTALDNPKVGAPKPVNMGHYANKPQDQGGAERIRFDAQTSPGQKSMPSNGMVTGPNPKGFTVPGVGFTEPTNAPSNPAKKSDVGLDGKGQKKRQLKDASMKASNTFGKALPGQKPAGLPAVAPKVAPLPHAGNTTGAAKIGAVSKQPIQPMSAKPGMSLKAPAKPVAPAGTPKPFGKSELGNCALCSKAEHAGTCN